MVRKRMIKDLSHLIFNGIHLGEVFSALSLDLLIAKNVILVRSSQPLSPTKDHIVDIALGAGRCSWPRCCCGCLDSVDVDAGVCFGTG